MKNTEVLEIARETIGLEAKAIGGLMDALDHNFCALVKKVSESKGRLVLTGIGKNTHIGNKIAATLNSTGTPALFMHAGDAIHGDLGMIQPEDIVICLSKSGNSAEVKVLVPLINSLGNFLVGFVCDTESVLAKQASLIINIPVGEEACPHNLTPTTSTTAFLVMGDALAVSLLRKRGFSASDFKKLHPGGTLGKRLYMKVSDLYPLNEKPQVLVNTSLKSTILEMSGKRLGATAVLDHNNRLAGIITDGDLRRTLEKHNSLENLTAESAMSPTPKTITPDAPAVEALNTMRSNNITQLLVCDNNEYLGVIHLHDILQQGIV